MDAYWNHWRDLALKYVQNYLYVIHMSYTPYYKIGITTSPDSRFRALQTASPYDLHITRLYNFKNENLLNEAEKGLHTYLSDKRQRGEWFDLEPTELSHITDVLVLEYQGDVWLEI